MKVKDLLKYEGLYLIRRPASDKQSVVAVLDGKAYPMLAHMFDDTDAVHVRWLRRCGIPCPEGMLDLQCVLISHLPLPLPE